MCALSMCEFKHVCICALGDLRFWAVRICASVLRFQSGNSNYNYNSNGILLHLESTAVVAPPLTVSVYLFVRLSGTSCCIGPRICCYSERSWAGKCGCERSIKCSHIQIQMHTMKGSTQTANCLPNGHCFVFVFVLSSLFFYLFVLSFIYLFELLRGKMWESAVLVFVQIVAWHIINPQQGIKNCFARIQ